MSLVGNKEAGAIAPALGNANLTNHERCLLKSQKARRKLDENSNKPAVLREDGHAVLSEDSSEIWSITPSPTPQIKGVLKRHFLPAEADVLFQHLQVTAFHTPFNL